MAAWALSSSMQRPPSPQRSPPSPPSSPPRVFSHVWEAIASEPEFKFLRTAVEKTGIAPLLQDPGATGTYLLPIQAVSWHSSVGTHQLALIIAGCFNGCVISLLACPLSMNPEDMCMCLITRVASTAPVNCVLHIQTPPKLGALLSALSSS